MAADVVDDLGSSGDGMPGCCGVEGVYGQDGLWALFEDGFDGGEDAGLFFFRGQRCRVRTGGFAAHVEDVGAFVEHLESVCYGAVGRAVGRVLALLHYLVLPFSTVWCLWILLINSGPKVQLCVMRLFTVPRRD